MRKILYFSVLACVLHVYSSAQGVKISNSGTAPDPSAQLEIESANKGVLMPQVDLQAANDATSILQPATSLVIYNTGQTLQPAGFYYNMGTPVAPVWVLLFTSPANTELDMNNFRIENLAPPINGNDAVNKNYLDNALLGLGGGGTGMDAPTAVSLQSPNPMTFGDAVAYCENLAEGGNNDWRIPTADELAYFTKTNGASADFLWTKSLTFGKDFATNQNFITYRLTDGKWTDGGINRFYFPTRVASGTISYSPPGWQTAATFNPLTTNNLFVLTSMKWTVRNNYYVNGNGSGQSGSLGEFRLKYNFPDGSSYYSEVFASSNAYYGYSTSSTYLQTVMDIQTIPILNENAAYSSIELQINYVAPGPNQFDKWIELSVSGYEISLSQKDGQTLHCRCVRY